jgi:tRNA(fMet)-specific endonuclease VapC
MTRYMLDTNTVSYLMRGHEAVEKAIFSKDYDDLCISSMTEAELLYGVGRKPEATRRARMVHEFLDRVESLPWGREEAACYGRTRAAMERSGKNLQPVDMLIAAHALSLGATLVTSDQAFRHVPGLAIEDWS